MPNFNVVNLDRAEAAPNQAEENLKTFFSKMGEQYKEKSENVAIDSIINQYKQNRQDINAWEDMNLAIENDPNIRPTRRLELKKGLSDEKKILIERDKTLNAQAKAAMGPKKTQASQPIDPEQLDKIQSVRNLKGYKEASPSDKYRMLTDNGVSRENAKAEADLDIEEKKLAQPGQEFAKGREKAVLDYVNNAIETGKEAEDMKYVLETAKQAVQGEVAGPGFEAFAKNNPYVQLFTGLTPDEATLNSANKKLLEGAKGIFGSKPTEREIFLLLNSMLPSIGKTQEANMAGLTFLENLNEMKLMHSDIIDELTEGGTKFVPDLERQVAERMRPISEQFRDQLRQAQKSLAPQQQQKKSEQVGKTKPGFVQVKDPEGVMRWIPEDVAQQEGLL